MMPRFSKNKTSEVGMEDWQIENDLRTLVEAKKIERDPKRMAACRKMAAKKADEMNAVKLAMGDCDGDKD